jgi:ABC-2 type transport system ATP-binding protein
VPQEPALYENLSARENLSFWGGLYGLSGVPLKQAVDRVLELVGLTDRAKDPVKQYSGGMKRRINLALGLVHGPRAVLMDEPTVGIDPQARLNILEAVKQVASAGTTVIYTTHYLEEVEQLCDRIAIMDHGKILAEGTLDELKRRVGGRDVVTVRGGFDAETARPRFEALPGVQVTSVEPGRLVLSVEGSGRGAVDLLSRVLADGLSIDGISIQPPSLNTLFLNLTGRELRD